jgi:hypothetical protein
VNSRRRPEVLAEITDSAFDLPLFPAAGWIAAMGKEAMIAGKKPRKPGRKPDQRAIVFDNGGGQVIVCDFARHPTVFGLTRCSSSATSQNEAQSPLSQRCRGTGQQVSLRVGIARWKTFVKVMGIGEENPAPKLSGSRSNSDRALSLRENPA